jgi:hypothetical protein
MNTFHLPATDRTPEVAFDFAGHHLRLSGESYPEDAATFYGPVFAALDDYLGRLDSGGACRFDIALIYFNSSSAKILMMLLERLDRAAGRGAAIDIHWHFDEDDDTMEELGSEFGEDVAHARFHLVRMTPADGG